MNKFYTLLFLLIVFKAKSQFITAEVAVWWTANIPLVLTMENSSVPNGLKNSSSVRQHLVSAVNQWNNDPSLGSLVLAQEGLVNDTPSSYTQIDGSNEIIFSVWPISSNVAARTRRWSSSECNYFTPGYPGSCVKRIVETDVFFNFYKTFTLNSCPNGGNNATGVLRHEIGHALGLIHNGSLASLMSGDGVSCINPSVRAIDYENLKDLYPSLDTVDIIINTPNNAGVLIGNEPNEFSAKIVPFGSSNRAITAVEFKAMEDQLVWTSSVDGQIATGNNQQVTGLSSGQHDLTVTIGQPGDQVFGDGTSSFFVINEVITTDANNFHPYPCPRSIGHVNNPCLMSTKYDLYRYRCIDRNYGHGDMSARDKGNDAVNPNDDINIPIYVDPFPRCLTDYTTYTFNFHTWLYSDDNLVDFELNYTLEDLFTPVGYRTYRHPIPMVNSEITVFPIENCSVANISQKCSTVIEWYDLFFAPDAGIFYRDSPTSPWELLKSISDRNGSYQTGNIVDVDGVEFAVFQYAHDVKGRNENGTPGTGATYIHAPSGMMAGPISVNAISDNTDPVPVLDSVEAIGSKTFKIELLGDDFGGSPSVSVRENISGSQPLFNFTPEYYHNQGTHVSTSPNAGKNYIRFPILKESRQNLFKNNGLCFKVFSGEHESNEICYQIPPRETQAQYMGSTVQSYVPSNSALEDIDKESYVTSTNGNLLKLWGNTWKKVPMNYTVTSSTELEINFKSTHSEGEIIGVGFILNGQSVVSASRFWQLHGTELWGNQEHHNYAGTAYKTYKIKVGEKFTGQISHMVFAADYDNQQAAQNVVFQTPTLSEISPANNIFMGKLVESYNQPTLNQDIEPNAYNVIDGNKLNIWGNSWKKIAYNYTVTPQTVLEFTFKSSAHEAEINGIGFIMNNGSQSHSAARFWQVHGTQVHGNQQFNDYTGSADKVYRIPIGESFTGEIAYMIFAADHDNQQAAQNVVFQTPTLSETAPENNIFMGKVVESYNPPTLNQDIEPNAYNVIDGNKLNVWGNSWKKIAYNYTVTPQTVLEFTFKSSAHEAEINGIGFIMNNGSQSHSAARFWQVHGTQVHGNQQFNDYTGSADKVYRIPIGESFTGEIAYMIFAADEDTEVGQNIVYQSPALFEDSNSFVADQFDDVPAQRAFDDDAEGRGSSWQSAHTHNFHDAADVDWVLVSAKNFKVNVTEIGQNAQTKLTAYRWLTGSFNTSLGYYTGINSVLVGSNGSEYELFSDTHQVYAFKMEPGSNQFGAGTEYKIHLETIPLGAADNYDNLSQSSHTDDLEQYGVSWGAGDTFHSHNFHDQGDVDWTLVYAQNFTAQATAVGEHGQTKMEVYKWDSADVGPDGYTNIVHQLVGSDLNGGNSLVQVTSGESTIFAIKVESSKQAYGDKTNYHLRLY